MPRLELNPETRKDDIFSPKAIVSPSTQMSRTFKNFEAFKNDISPRGSKAQFS